jgi:RimJ/RimL family protein N-acetyltransferase
MPALIRRLKTVVVKHPLSRWLWRDDRLCVVRAGPESLALLPDTPEVVMDSWAHMELFEQTESWLSRDQFLNMARRRLERGLHVFSIVDGGVLASFVWLEPNRATATYSEVGQELALPDKSCTSFHGYTHPKARGKKYYTKCKVACMRWAFTEGGCQHLFTAIDPSNHVSLHVAKKLGFEVYARLYRRTRFGHQRHAAELSADAAATGKRP